MSNSRLSPKFHVLTHIKILFDKQVCVSAMLIQVSLNTGRLGKLFEHTVGADCVRLSHDSPEARHHVFPLLAPKTNYQAITTNCKTNTILTVVFTVRLFNNQEVEDYSHHAI